MYKKNVIRGLMVAAVAGTAVMTAAPPVFAADSPGGKESGPAAVTLQFTKPSRELNLAFSSVTINQKKWDRTDQVLRMRGTNQGPRSTRGTLTVVQAERLAKLVQSPGLASGPELNGPACARSQGVVDTYLLKVADKEYTARVCSGETPTSAIFTQIITLIDKATAQA